VKPVSNHHPDPVSQVAAQGILLQFFVGNELQRAHMAPDIVLPESEGLLRSSRVSSIVPIFGLYLLPFI
jgi:hypothetical protein